MFDEKSYSLKMDKAIEVFIKELSSLVCYGFQISQVKIFPKYLQISDISNSKSIFNNRIRLNEILYNLSKNKKNELTVKNENKITDFLNSKVDLASINYNIQKYVKSLEGSSNITYKKIISEILDREPENIKYFNESLPNQIKFIYYKFDSYSYLIYKNLIFSPPNEFSTFSDKYDRNPELRNIESNTFRKVYQ